jgi:putative adhesin
MRIAIGGWIVLAVLATSCTWDRGVRATEELRIEKTLSSDAACVVVDNVVGDLRVETWDRDQVLVVAKKEAQGATDEAAREMLAKMSVDVQATADGLSIATRLPSGESSGGVSYRIQVPKWARVDARVVTGDVTLDGVGGGVRADVTTGSVRLDGVSAPASVKVVTGEIDASVTDLAAPVSLEATTGRISVGLPKGQGAMLDAQTSVGSISCGYDVSVARDSPVGASVKGAVNGGGPDVRVRIQTGEIRLSPQPRAKA